jgi:DNA-binding cell septation regulator SpoVG
MKIKIESVNISTINDPKRPKTKATAVIATTDGMEINGFNIVAGDKGLFVGWPAFKTDNGYKYIISISDKDVRKYINDTILQEYNESLGKSKPIKRTEPPIDEPDSEPIF